MGREQEEERNNDEGFDISDGHVPKSGRRVIRVWGKYRICKLSLEMVLPEPVNHEGGKKVRGEGMSGGLLIKKFKDLYRSGKISRIRHLFNKKSERLNHDE